MLPSNTSRGGSAKRLGGGAEGDRIGGNGRRVWQPLKPQDVLSQKGKGRKVNSLSEDKTGKRKDRLEQGREMKKRGALKNGGSLGRRNRGRAGKTLLSRKVIASARGKPSWGFFFEHP